MKEFQVASLAAHAVPRMAFSRNYGLRFGREVVQVNRCIGVAFFGSVSAYRAQAYRYPELIPTSRIVELMERDL